MSTHMGVRLASLPKISFLQIFLSLRKVELPEPFLCQVILSESLPLGQVILELRAAKFGQGRKNPIKIFTFRQLTLQCCHHSLTQFHSQGPQFIQNQAPIHRLSHHLYARYQNPWKVHTQCFRNNTSLTSHCIFADLNVKTTQQEVIEFSPFIERKFV